MREIARQRRGTLALRALTAVLAVLVRDVAAGLYLLLAIARVLIAPLLT